MDERTDLVLEIAKTLLAAEISRPMEGEGHDIVKAERLVSFAARCGWAAIKSAILEELKEGPSTAAKIGKNLYLPGTLQGSSSQRNWVVTTALVALLKEGLVSKNEDKKWRL